MQNSAHISITSGPRLEVSSDKLGTPGAPIHLTAVAIMPNEERSDEKRLHDTSRRTFQVATLLVRTDGFLDHINGDFTKDDGSSHVRLKDDVAMLKVETSDGKFEIQMNENHEMSMISMSVEANNAIGARNFFQDSVSPFLDHLSFLAKTPILTGIIRIQDDKNQVSTLDLIAPERSVTLNSGGQILFEDLAPIYALYREFKNSVSPFYRLICAYKIMEGIYGVLRTTALKRAREAGVDLKIPKEVIPDHPHIAPDLRHLIGEPIKAFCDKTLQKRYRDAAAHFLVQESVVLKVSSAAERSRFAEMAFLCDLCAQIVIHNHERVLAQLNSSAS